jgi:hypothetical protein
MAEFQRPPEPNLVTHNVGVLLFSFTLEETQRTSRCTDPDYLHFQNAFIFYVFSWLTSPSLSPIYRTSMFAYALTPHPTLF